MRRAPLGEHIESWPLSRIREYAGNPRKNEGAVERMCASIREFGFKIPCLARSNGELVDGHLRLKAARRLGLREVPVMLCDEWTEAQVKAFRLLVNRSATWAEFDEELLAVELQGLGAADFDLSLTGFDVGEIGELLSADDGERELSQAEACATVSRAGDVWICGAHRVVCGGGSSREVDVMVERWQKLTGNQATLEGEGRSFEEVARDGAA